MRFEDVDIRDVLKTGKRLGTGGSRVVIEYKGAAYKFATSPTGVLENDTEFKNGFLDDVAAECHYKDEALGFVVSEILNTRNKKEIRRLLKPILDFNTNHGSHMAYKKFQRRDSDVWELLDKMGSDDQRFVSLLEFEDLLWGDLIAIRNWGLAKNGDLKLLDKGLLLKDNFLNPNHFAKQEWLEINKKRKKLKVTVTALKKVKSFRTVDKKLIKTLNEFLNEK